jgi:aspartate/tyrosine/aromatic aminotransferase
MHSGASEYELYFHYMVANHNDKIEIRKLRWQNVKNLDTNCGLDYISYHYYDR